MAKKRVPIFEIRIQHLDETTQIRVAYSASELARIIKQTLDAALMVITRL